MQFREAAIQHTIEDAIQLFNDSFGLDFSASDLARSLVHSALPRIM